MDKNISFSFTKTAKKSKIVKIDEDVQTLESVTDLLTSIEDKELKGNKPKEVKRKLVIPLIGTNKWRIPGQTSAKAKAETDKPIAEIQVRDEAEDLAVKELLQEAANAKENGDDSTHSRQQVVPLLVQNAVPAGYETDNRLDVTLRPNESEEADYSQIPIEEFGFALLRGMGWKEEDKKDDKTVKPVETIARPKGLGLGADRKRIQQVNYQPANQSKDNKEEALVLGKGSHCVVTSGKLKDLYAQIEGVDMENSRVIVKMSLSGDKVTLSQFAVKLVTDEEYKKYSKYLNKGKSDQYKEREAREKEKKKRRSGEDSDNSDDKPRNSKHGDGNHSNSKRRDRDRKNKSEDYFDNSDDSKSSSSRKRKHKKKEDEERDSSKRKNRSRSRSRERADHRASLEQLWLRPHLRVRIVDEEYKKGRYFKQKVVVEDIASIDCCVCKTDDGRVLEDLSQHQLETVIPRGEPAYVMILAGKHRTKVAEVLRKDKDSYEATVQLLSDRDTVFVTSYDAMCEYVGNVQTELDF